jgi:hypothetical protein
MDGKGERNAVHKIQRFHLQQISSRFELKWYVGVADLCEFRFSRFAKNEA